MTLISFVSAKGSPGVTQTVAGLSIVWPRRAAVADLDPIGGDVSLRHQADNGGPLDLDRGLVSLGAALRGGKAADLGDHLQTTEDGMHTLVGVAAPGQVQGLGATWPHIGSTLSSYQDDVLADCGRFTPGSPIMPVIERSSALVFVARSEVASLAHLRERLRSVREQLGIGAVDGIPVGVVLVGDPRDTRSAEDTEQLLAAAGLPVRALGIVADDPKTVRSLRTGTGRNIARAPLIRSLIDVSTAIHSLVADRALARMDVR
jgi:MinD-like ATPase involved in chromosome partitioning or flagellar assembly